MRCPETNELAAYLDGAVTHAERIRWDDHFRQCLKCRKDLEELKMLLTMEPLDPGEESLVMGMALVDGTRQARASADEGRYSVPWMRH